jgi:hypothetical protein
VIGCRKRHYEELHSLYSAPNVIGLIKSRSLKLAGHMACIAMINTYKILVGSLK